MAKVYKGNITGNIVELSLQDEAAGGGGGGTVQTPSTLQIRAADEGTVPGDPRGANSVDLQTVRTASTQVASGSESMILGGHGNTASGPSSEVIGSHDSTTTGTGSTVIGGNTINNAGNWSVAAGGRNHEIVAARVGVLGGEHAEVLTGHNDSVMLGVRGTGVAKKQSQAAETAHVDNLYIFNGFTMPTGAADTYVLTSDANGVGTWQAAAGGGGGGTVQGTDATYDIQAANEGATPGNARGENSVDLQTARSLATQVASGQYATIGGGYRNTANGTWSTVGGGIHNTASNVYSTTSGGYDNTASGTYSTVSGGYKNTAIGNYSTISGGLRNAANGVYSTVSGGADNDAIGDHSWAGGKYASTGGFDGTFAWNDGGAPGNLDITAITIPNAANQFAIKAAGGLRLIDGNQAAGYVLTCDAAGVGTWQAAGGGGGGGTVQGTDATYDIQAANEGTTPGNARGENSVDLQTARSAATQVASGQYSTVGGGKDNTASVDHSTISGGYNNTANGTYSAIGGGYGNTTSESSYLVFGCSTVSGGRDNTASGTYSTIGGGLFNTASDYYSTVGGGYDNDASDNTSTIGGGAFNTASDYYSTVGGGYDNTASGNNSTVSGGLRNNADGDYSWAGGKYASTGLFDNTFAWNDGGAPGNLDIAATPIPNAANQFAIKAAGGLRLIDGNEAAGYVLTSDADGVGTWQVKDNSRTTATIQTIALADATSATLNLAVAKSYILHKIETSHAAWVTLYVDDASRVADAGRAETTDPLPGSGVIAEVITSGAETQLITPGTIGWNNDGIPATTAYLKVENQSGATNNIDVTLYYVQLEA